MVQKIHKNSMDFHIISISFTWLKISNVWHSHTHTIHKHSTCRQFFFFFFLNPITLRINPIFILVEPQHQIVIRFSVVYSYHSLPRSINSFSIFSLSKIYHKSYAMEQILIYAITMRNRILYSMRLRLNGNANCMSFCVLVQFNFESYIE